MDILLIASLLVVYQLKHFVADYLLQGTYMLGKFKLHGWERPLFAHASVHGVITLFVASMVVSPDMAAILAVCDMSIHFVVDRLKVVFSRDYDSKTDKEFWWLLGLDQMAHHFTHYVLIYVMYTNYTG